MERRGVAHDKPLDGRLEDEAKRLRQEARGTPPGIERDRLIRKASRAENCSAHERVAEVVRLTAAEGTLMTKEYYAYVYDEDGHIRNRIDVFCDNDEEATRCAEQLVDGQVIELSQETRKIAIFPIDRSRRAIANFEML